MRRTSLYFTAPGKTAVQEDTLPAPSHREVLVKTLVSAISAGTELLIYRGQAPAGLPVDETIPALRVPFGYPLKYGYSVAGRVEQTGPEVDEQWRGKLVFAFHPHESHFTCAVEELVPVPPGVSAEDAVFLANTETAVNLIMDGQPAIGEQVAVFGQGVVGLLTTALLSRLSLASLVTVDPYPTRRQRSMELGATTSVDPGEGDTPARIRALLQGDRPYSGADLAYETSGAPEALDTALAVAGFNGRIVVGSWYGTKEATLHLGGRFHRDRMSVISSQVSTIAPQWSARWTKPRRLGVAWSALQSLRPSSLVTHRFPIGEAPEAYRLLDQRPDEALQVLLEYPD